MMQQQLDEANSKNAELSHCLWQTQLDGQKQMEEFCRQLEELRLTQILQMTQPAQRKHFLETLCIS